MVATAPVSAATTQETIKALMAQIAALQAQVSNTTTTTITTKTYVHVNTLRVGSRGEQVKQLQSCLNRIGDNTGVVDGIFGPNTKRGVMSFQSKNGLAVDGIVGPKTGIKYEVACAINTNNTTVVEEKTTDDRVKITSDEEGSLSSIKIDEGDDDVLKSDKKNQESFIVEAKADEDGGDVKIERLDLTFAAKKASANYTKLYRLIDAVTVDGRSLDTDSRHDWRGANRNTVRISGLNIVVKAGEEKEIKILLDTPNYDDDKVSISLNGVEVRTVDGAGLSDKVKSETSESATVDTNNKKDVFRVSSVSADKDQETKGILALDENIDDATVAEYVVKTADNDEKATLTDATVTAEVTIPTATKKTAGLDVDDFVSKLYFYVDGKEIDSSRVKAKIANTENKATITADFDLDDLKVDSDEEYNVTVKADFRELEKNSEFKGATFTTKTIKLQGEDSDQEDLNQTQNGVNEVVDVKGTVLTALAGDVEASIDGKISRYIGDPINTGTIVFNVKITNNTGNDINDLLKEATWTKDSLEDVQGVLYFRKC